MRIADWIRENTELLKEASVPSPRLDTELLLCHLLSVDRSWLAAHADDDIEAILHLKGHSLQILDMLIQRRKNHEPISYILGRQEFYGREFIVTPDTLAPRPESETMITLLLDELQKLTNLQQQILILDVGTGSGCLLISAALEINSTLNLSAITYAGLDISHKALRVAQKNAINHSITATFKQYNLRGTAPLTESTYDAVYILANLPYVPDNYPINKAAQHEPTIALFGGQDGLEYYRLLFTKVTDTNNCTILCESLEFQHKQLASLASKFSLRCVQTEGLMQIFKR